MTINIHITYIENSGTYLTNENTGTYFLYHAIKTYIKFKTFKIKAFDCVDHNKVGTS